MHCSTQYTLGADSVLRLRDQLSKTEAPYLDRHVTKSSQRYKQKPGAMWEQNLLIGLADVPLAPVLTFGHFKKHSPTLLPIAVRNVAALKLKSNSAQC